MSLQACPNTAETTGIDAVADHGHGQRAAQGVHPADLARRELDPGAGSVSRQPGGDRRGAPKRVERVTMLDEHLRTGRPKLPQFGPTRSNDPQGMKE